MSESLLLNTHGFEALSNDEMMAVDGGGWFTNICCAVFTACVLVPTPVTGVVGVVAGGLGILGSIFGW